MELATSLPCGTTNFLKDLSVPLQELGVVHEAKLLMLDISKAKFQLGWEPKMNISETVALTIDWYKRYTSENIYELCIEQINYYSEFTEET